jgi:toxin ParE1/3/4
MKSYRLTEAAQADIFEIWSYIAPDNPTAADRIESEILDLCQRLAERPDLGHFRRDLTDKELRFFAVRGTYLIVYNPAREPLEILRVLHGAREVGIELS